MKLQRGGRQSINHLRALITFVTTRYRLLPLLLLLAGTASAKVIGDTPGQTVQALATWYILNCNQSGGVGSYSISIGPQYGSVSFGSASGVAPGCPAGSASLPAVVAYYTMNDGTPPPTSDFFQLQYILNGTVAATENIYVLNTAIVGKQLGGQCNCSGKAPVGGTGSGDAGDPGNPGGSGPLQSGFNSLPDAQSPHLGYVRTNTGAASGNVFYSVTDYTTSGQNPLSFTRYYNSLAAWATPLQVLVASPSFRSVSALDVQARLPEGGRVVNSGDASAPPESRQEFVLVASATLASELGGNWRSTFDRFLKITTPTTVIAERPDGQQLNFKLNGSTWTPDADIDVTLAQSGSTWTLIDANDTVETYTVVPLASGAPADSLYSQLQSIQLRNGYTQTLTYSGNTLSAVTDSYGRSLTFTYTGSLLQSVTTPDGLVVSYGYTAASTGSQLTSATYSTTPTTSQSYLYEDSGLPFALTGIIDEDGNRYATWGYDGAGRGTSSELGAGANATAVVFNSDGSSNVTNASGVQDAYKFTILQNVPKVTEIDRAATASTAAATEFFSYDGNGYLASLTDWNGNLTTFINNSHGLPTIINEAVGSSVSRNTTITYDSTWVHLPASISTAGLTLSFTYDTHGEQLTRTLTDTTTSGAPYATAGQKRTWVNSWSNFLLASVQSPNGNTTNYGYDTTGALTSITDALRHTTQITSHTGGGLPEVVVDPNGVTTTITYDARQRPTSSTVSGSGSFATNWGYDAAGDLIKATLPDGSYLANSYDPAHRLTKVTDGLGNYVAYTLDALGDRTQTGIYTSSGTLTRQRSDTYDALGRSLVDTGGAGQTTTSTYDPNGNALTVTDGLGHTTKNTYDALNRTATSTDANFGVTTLAYDAHDRLVSVTDANGNPTSYVRDGFGDVIQQTSPDAGISVFHYDGDSNLASKRDALGIDVNQSFDALDRPLTRTYPAHSAENVAFTYDQTGTGFAFGIGRLTSVTDAAGSLTRAYDERGNLASETRVNGAMTLVTSYGYDGANRIAGIGYPDGTSVRYQRDAAGYLTKATALLPGAASATTLATLTHQPFGPMNAATYGNGVAESWSYDKAYRATNITDMLSGAGVQNLTYAYDNADNVTSIADALNAANSQTLGYDVINRLTSAVSGTGGYGSFTWTYDKVGNRQTQVEGTTTTTYGYTPGTNRLLTITTTTASSRVSGPILRERRLLPPLWAGLPARAFPRVTAALKPSHPRRASVLSSGFWGWPVLLTGFAGLLSLRKRVRIHRLLTGVCLVALLTGSLMVLEGCVTGGKSGSELVPVRHLAIQGVVHGGEPPVIGSTIQLYAVGTTGDGSAATPLLHSPVTTDASGSFSITSDYTCPSATTQVYLVSTGGNPGLSAGTNNTAITLMAALGPCGSLTASTFIFVNELTTVGSLAALYPFMSSAASLGAGSSDAAALTSAFASVSEYTNTTTGAVPGPALPSGYYASSIEIQTLADVVAACINSAGGAAGDGSPCGNLLALATPSGGTAPTDTIRAILNILDHPTANVASLFALVTPSAPFEPSLTAAPASWSLPILPLPVAPTITPAGGTYSAALTVTISGATTGSTLFYTTDGTIPTTSSARYTGPITVTSSETIQAIAAINSYVSSPISSAAFALSTGTSSPSTITVATNANGNIISIPPANSTAYASFAYNDANRLASVTGSPIAASFVYDWAGQRFSKTDNGSTPILYSYMQGGMLISENNGGTTTDYVYADGRPIAIVQPGATTTTNQVTYVHADRLGTPQLVTNSAGSTVWSTTYQPFGATGTITASSTQNLRFPGQYFDAETDFSYNISRDYMTNVGRFLESDSLGLGGGVNTYLYAKGNPNKFIDKLGRQGGDVTSTGLCLWGGCLGIEVTYPTDPSMRNWYFSTGASVGPTGLSTGPYGSSVYADDPDNFAGGWSLQESIGPLVSFGTSSNALALGIQLGEPNLSCSYSTRINRDFDYYYKALDQPGNEFVLSLFGFDYSIQTSPMYPLPIAVEPPPPSKSQADWWYYSFGPGSAP